MKTSTIGISDSIERAVRDIVFYFSVLFNKKVMKLIQNLNFIQSKSEHDDSVIHKNQEVLDGNKENSVLDNESMSEIDDDQDTQHNYNLST